MTQRLARTRGIDGWAARAAQARPEAAAIVDGGVRLSYGEMDRQANRLARMLAEQGVRRGDRVALLARKSAAAIAAMQGVLRAGGVYVPVDPASPPARAASVLEQCGCEVALADPSAQALLAKLTAEPWLGQAPRVGWFGAAAPVVDGVRFAFADSDLEALSPEPLDSPPAEIAHILFTSGSTGTPKGVPIRHSSVAAYIDWVVEEFDLGPGDRLSGHSPLSFDLSTQDIYSAFAAGAELHLVPPQLNLLPHKLAQFMRDADLTQWFSVPSLLSYLAAYDSVRPGDFPAMKRLLWCGEKFAAAGLIYWMSRLPHVAFTNLYGPTEATIASSFYHVPSIPADPLAEIPVGRACPGERLYVLDQAMRPAPPGEVGDLYIAGAGLSPGYWRDEAKTAAAFVDNPFAGDEPDAEAHPRLYRTGDLARWGADGLVYLLGRSDSQIKRLGHRIELGEIEAALEASGAVDQGAIVSTPAEGFEGANICCAYVPRAGEPLDERELRRRLTALLPAYMLPNRWLRYDRLPVNGSGKIHRAQLREDFLADGASTSASL